jgi:hypothetical protein
MSRMADFLDVERCVRVVYPSGHIEEPDLAAVDLHLDSDGVARLANAIVAGPCATAATELEVVKSHIIHVGGCDAPDWEEFNRGMTPPERRAAVARCEDGLAYWNVKVSRMGPFWTGYWNTFRLQGDRVVPESSGVPGEYEWVEILRHTKTVLSSNGLLEISREMLDRTLRWFGRNEDGVTVYDALFSDIY